MKYNHSFDPLGRFYTQPTVSEALVDLINANPATIVDLGSGGGSLAIAAGKRWKHAEITTIDIDEKANLSRNSLSTLKSRGRHTHLVSDILPLINFERIHIRRRSCKGR